MAPSLCLPPPPRRPPPGAFAHHAAGVARLNHGSFGAAPAGVLQAQRAAAERWRAQPDALYFSGELDGELQRACDAAARAFGCTPSRSALVENATLAAAAVASRWASRLGPGDVTLCASSTYGGVKSVLRHYCERLGGGRLVEVQLGGVEAHLDSAAVVAAYAAAAQKHRARFAVVDHVVSQPSALLPVREVAAACRAAGVEEVMVDGAHSAGNVPGLRVEEQLLGCGGEVDCRVDYWFSNLHKWAFASNSVCLMSWAPGKEDGLHHPVPSWNYGGGFAAEARWAGTRDWSAFLSVPSALEFWQSMGGDGLALANAQASLVAARWLSETWGTPMPPQTALQTALQMVRLPGGNAWTPESVGRLRTRMREEHNVEASVVRLGAGQGPAHLRLSMQLAYTDEDDVRRLATAVEQEMDAALKG